MPRRSQPKPPRRLLPQPRQSNISAHPPEPRKPPPSAWSCWYQLQLSRQQRPINFRLQLRFQNLTRSSDSHAASNPSKRPARSRRRPFGIPSPYRKNDKENCRFTRDWQSRRPPASPSAAGKLSRSHDTPRSRHSLIPPPQIS
jgi:hypothetical protein